VSTVRMMAKARTTDSYLPANELRSSCERREFSARSEFDRSTTLLVGAAIT
jgi:hypothetical protein